MAASEVYPNRPTTDGFKVLDSGARTQFGTGAVRDTEDGKGRYDLLSTHAARRLAIHLQKGAAKYGDRNWEKGMPVERLVSSAKRHLDQFLELHRGERPGDPEDHASAAHFNTMAILHFDELERMKRRSDSAEGPVGQDEAPPRPSILSKIPEQVYPKPAETKPPSFRGAEHEPKKFRTRRTRVYLSGPMTNGGKHAVDWDRIKAAVQVGVQLMEFGYSVLMPQLTAYAHRALEYGEVETIGFNCGLDHKTWIDADLAWVEASDVVLRMPGESKGADIECAHAKSLGIDVQHEVPLLRMRHPPYRSV